MKCQYKTCKDLATRQVYVNGIRIGKTCLPHADDTMIFKDSSHKLLPVRKQKRKLTGYSYTMIIRATTTKIPKKFYTTGETK